MKQHDQQHQSAIPGIPSRGMPSVPEDGAERLAELPGALGSIWGELLWLLGDAGDADNPRHPPDPVAAARVWYHLRFDGSRSRLWPVCRSDRRLL
jgi:hypothetical protein